MKTKKKTKVLLFISRNSVYFNAGLDEFKQIMLSLSHLSPIEVQTIDVSQNPELAEKYQVSAIPTLIINDKRYIGNPTPEKVLEVFERSILS